MAVAGEALLKNIEDILDDLIIDRQTVEAAAALYITYFRHHLAYEENCVLPRAAKVLTQEDWAAVSAAIPEVPDPLFGESVAARYRELRESISREAFARASFAA